MPQGHVSSPPTHEKGAYMTAKNYICDDGTPLSDHLTADELELMDKIGDEAFDRYLEAQSSYEAIKAYLEDPDEPAEAKALLSLDAWAESQSEE